MQIKKVEKDLEIRFQRRSGFDLGRGSEIPTNARQIDIGDYIIDSLHSPACPVGRRQETPRDNHH